MAMKDDGATLALKRRRVAKTLARRAASGKPEAGPARTPGDSPELKRQLSTHQVELEAQNEELRRIQAELEAARARYFDLYQHAPVAYLTLSAEGLILEANHNASALLGVAPGMLPDRSITQFILMADQDTYYQYRRQFRKTGEPFACDLQMTGQGGASFWAHVTVTASREGAQDPGAILLAPPASRMVLVDITDRRRLEREKGRFESDLQQTQKMETIGVLAGGVAHDFNNLLTTIAGNAAMGALALTEGADAAPHFEIIEKTVMKAADLTRQLLAYAGKGKYQVSEVDLNVTALETVQILSGAIAPPVTLQCDLAERLPWVKADATQVFQILMNLITNAREAFPPGTEGRITVRTRAENLDQAAPPASPWVLPLRPGRYVSLEVADTGPGMAPEVLAKVFEPFFSTKFSGRGLGLAAVLGILRRHGGGLNVRSEPGHGSSFKLFLPAMAEPRAGAAFEAPPAWRGEGRLLLVDGDPADRHTARHMGEQLGFTVLEARDGPEAMDQFRLHHGSLALVLLDPALPGGNGWDLLRAMRDFDPAVPLALSSGPGATDGETAVEGLAGVLRKPIRLAEFQGLLQRAMARNRTA